MSVIVRPRIICKRPVIVKKPLRRMEQSVFKTIVEMANEMDFADKQKRDLRNAQNVLEAILPHVQTTMNWRVLRRIDITRNGEEYFTEPFIYRGLSLRFAIYMEYERYRERGGVGRVREKGVITISPQQLKHNDYYCLHRLMYSRREYRSRDEVLDKLIEMKNGALSILLMI